MSKVLSLTLLVASVALSACGRAPADARMVSEYSRLLYGLVRVERASPPVASRMYAYVSAALYSGLAASNPAIPPIAGLRDFPAMPVGEGRTDETITAATAARIVLDSLTVDGLPTSRASVARLTDSLIQDRASQVSAATVDRSRELGTRVALAIIAWSHGDGFDSTRTMTYTPPVGAGLWINDSPADWYSTTNVSGASMAVSPSNPANVGGSSNVGDRSLILSPPKAPGRRTLLPVNMAAVAEPYWGTLRPFVLTAWDECPADASPMYGTKPGTPLYDEAMQVYETKRNLTPEQREIALYWADNPNETGTPSGHWLGITTYVASQRGLTGAEAARAMLVTSVALADGFIAAWGYKFAVNLIRPRTYIRLMIDPTWEPLIPTPPFPEYMSAHSAVSTAAATALTELLGAQPFDDSTNVSIGHNVRRFESFIEASNEAGQSRIYGGIHFPTGNIAGRTLGRCVGTKVIERLGASIR